MNKKSSYNNYTKSYQTSDGQLKWKMRILKIYEIERLIV